jgi:hypothetical protein
MRFSKSQVSIEYLAIFSIALFMTMPLLVIYFTQTENVQTDIAAAEIEKASSKVIDAAEAVYYMGEPAQKTITVRFPKSVYKVTVAGHNLTFNVSSTERRFYVVEKETIANLNGSIRNFEGPHIITFTAKADIVQITDK